MPKVWLITGTSRGLGRAFAEAALDAGDNVAATARNLSDLADMKRKYGSLVLPLALDVTNEAQAHTAVESTLTSFGKLDVLVNNAGYGNVAPIEDTSIDEFRTQIETNLFGVIILTKAGAAPLPRATLWTLHPGHFNRGANRSNRTRALRGSQVGR